MQTKSYFRTSYYRDHCIEFVDYRARLLLHLQKYSPEGVKK
jgi:hypothetical protein